MKYLKIFIPIFVVASVIFFLTYKKSETTSGVDDVTWIHAQPPATPAPLLSRIADEATLEKTNTPVEYSKACIDYWMKIANTPAKNYLAGLRSHNENLSQNCASFEPNIPFTGELYKTCALTKEKKFTDEASCVRWFKLYRAAQVDKLTYGENDFARLPDGVLLSKFVGRMSVAGEAALPLLRQMAADIKRRFPENPSTYKILAALEVLPQSMDTKAGADAAEQGLRLNPNDQELQSAWFYFKSQEPGFHFAQFVEAHPEYPYGQYYRAAQMWEAGQKEAAVITLANLQLKYPQDENFQETMSYLQNNDGEGENPFGMNFDLANDTW